MGRVFKRFIIISAIISGILILITGFIILRTPNISNLLKKAILPYIESRVGYNTMAEKMYINLFPTYLGVRNLKLVDKDGNTVMSVRRIKLYPDIAGLLHKRVDIRRLYLKEPSLTLNEERIENLKKRIMGEGGHGLLMFRDIEISDGNLSLLFNNKEMDASGVRIILRNINDLRIDVKRFIINRMYDYPLSISSRITLPVRDEDGIRIKRLLINGERTEIKSTGRISLSRESHGLNLDLKSTGSIYLERLMAILNVKEKISGKTEFDIVINGDIRDPSISGNGTLNKGDLFGVKVVSLRTGIHYSRGRFIFSNGYASLYGGRGRVEASFNIPPDDFSLDIRCEDIESRSLLELIKFDIGLPEGRVNGALYHKGRRFSPEGWFVYRIEETKEKNGLDYPQRILLSIKRITGSFHFDGDTRKLNLGEVIIEGGSSSIRTSGIIDTGLKTFDMVYHLSTEDISSLLPQGVNVHGRGTLDGRLSGNIKTPDILMKIILNNPLIYNHELESLEAVLKMEDSPEHGKRVSVERFILTKGTEEHRLKGRIYFPVEDEKILFQRPVFDLHMDSKNVDSGRIYPGLSRFLKKGYPLLNMNASINGDNNAMRMELYLTMPGRSHEDLKVKKEARTNLHAYLDILNWKIYDIHGKGFIRLAETGIDTEIIDGNLNIDLKGHGEIDSPALYLNIRADDIYLNKASTGPLRFDIILSKEEMNIAGFLMNEMLSLRGNISLVERESSVVLKIKKGEYTHLLRALFRELPGEIRLNMDGGLRLRGRARSISGTLELNNLRLTAYNYELKNEDPISINIENNLITLERFHLVNEGGEVFLDGRLMPSEWYDLRIKGNTHLLPLKRFLKSIETIKGIVNLDINIRGGWDEPLITGSLLLKDGTMGIEDIPYDVMDLNASLRFDGSRLLIESMNGKIGGGTVKAKGVAYMKGFHLGRFYIEADIKDLRAYIMKDLYANLDSKLYLRGVNQLNTISGEVLLKRADYRRHIEWKTYLMKSIKKEIPQIPPKIPSYMNAELNIKIKGPSKNGEIIIDNNIARMSIKADLLLRGNLNKPIILGRIESLRGIIYFRNNELKVVNASLDFTGSEKIDPYFQIRAETEARGYRIHLFMDGHLERFNLSLSSEPPLDEVDIIALLTLGETGTALRGYGGGIGATEATSFITGELQDTLEERARRFTGVDRVLISPYISSRGEVAPRITLSKKLSDKLSILYTTTAGSSEEQVIKLEYILNKGVSLVGQRDERGSLGGDIKFRFEFR